MAPLPPPTEKELKIYYSNFFPAELVWSFITKCFGEPSHNELVGFTFEKKQRQTKWTPAHKKPATSKEKEKKDAEFHTRYIHARDAKELRNKLVAHLPTGVSIGGLYSTPGELMKAASDISTTPMAKILSMDFDFDTFERSCDCDGKKQVCDLCWIKCQELMDIIKTASPSLARCIPLFVFSKNKGFHTHFPSPRLSTLSQNDRRLFLGLMEGRITKDSVAGLFDFGVTTQMDHTIRLPLSVASSGNIVLPIDANTSLQEARVHIRQIINEAKTVTLPDRWSALFSTKQLFVKAPDLSKGKGKERESQGYGGNNAGGEQNGGGGGGRGHFRKYRKTDEGKEPVEADDVVTELIALGADHKLLKTDPHACGIFYLLVPINALSDGAKRLYDLNQANKDSTWTYSAMLNWISESLEELGSVGQKLKDDAGTRDFFGDKGKPVSGKPTETATAEPRVNAARQQAAPGNHPPRSYAGGRDPNLHPPPDPTIVVQQQNPELPPAYAEGDGGAGSQAAPQPPQFANIAPEMQGDAGEIITAPPPPQPQPQQAAPAAENEGPPRYIHTPYFIRNEMVNGQAGALLVPKVRTSVIPLYKNFPAETTSVMDCSDPKKNLLGYLVTLVKLDPNFEFHKLFDLYIDKIKRKLARSLKNYAAAAAKQKSSVKRHSAKNMRFTGDVTQSNLDGLKIKNITDGSSPSNFIRSPKHAHQLLYNKYVCTLQSLIEDLVPTLKNAGGFDEEYRRHWEEPKETFAAFSEEKNETLDISFMRNWDFVQKTMRYMGVCEEQLPYNPWPQRLDYYYPETALGFTIPAEFSHVFKSYIFPSKTLMRFVIGSSQQAVVGDNKRLIDPSVDDLELLDRDLNASSCTMPRKGDLAELYLPHEQIANYHRDSISQAKQKFMAGDETASEELNNLLKAVLQDNDIKVTDKTVPNSRHVANCHDYVELLQEKGARFVECHPLAKGYGFVGQYLIYLNSKFTEIGVDRSHHAVLLGFLSGCSPVAMGYFSFAGIVPPSFMLCGHPSTGKSFAFLAACRLMVPGTFEEFQNTTNAGMKSFGKEMDMVAHIISEAQKVFTDPLKSLKGEEVELRKQIQTILSEQAIANKKFKTIYTNGEQRDLNVNEHVNIRTVFSGAKNQIALHNEMNDDPLFNRQNQVNMAGLTAELTDPQQPPLDRIDPSMGNHFTEFTRKIQCVSVAVWTRFIEPGIIPKPSTKLYYLYNDRLKRCPLFIPRPSRNISSLSLIYAVIVVQAAVFHLLGSLSPLLSYTFPEGVMEQDYETLKKLDPEQLSEILIEVEEQFHQEQLVSIGDMMGDNREAAVAVLSFAYLWDVPVISMLSSLMAAKNNAHPEFIRRCVQLKDRSLATSNAEAFNRRIDDATVSTDVMSNLYAWKNKVGPASALDFSNYFFSDEDDPTFVEKLYRETRIHRMTPNGGNQTIFEEGTEEYKAKKKEKLADVITILNVILYILHTPKNYRRFVHGGNVKDAKESDEFRLMDDYLKLVDEKNLTAAIAAEDEKMVKYVSPVQFIDRAIATAKEAYSGYFYNLHYIKGEQGLIRVNELEDALGEIDDGESLKQVLVFLNKKKNKFKEMLHAEQNTKQNHKNSDYFGKLHLPNSADEIIPKNKLPKFKNEANGSINPNYIEFAFSSNQQFYFLFAMAVTNANHKLKELSPKEIYYYLDMMTKIKMSHPQLPNIDASHLKSGVKASFIGQMFDPKELSKYPIIESPVLYYESGKTLFADEDGAYPNDTPKADGNDSATGAQGGAGGSSQMGSDGRISAGNQNRNGQSGGGDKGDNGNGGDKNGEKGKRGPKLHKAYLLVHYSMKDQQYFFDKMMEVIGSENTKEDVPVLGIFPSRKDVRMFATSKTRKGVAPVTFANPGFRNPKLKMAHKPRNSIFKKASGTVDRNNLFFTPFRDDMDQREIDMGVKDEEEEFYDCFMAENGFADDSCHPESIKQLYEAWGNLSIAAHGRVLNYPDDFGREMVDGTEENEYDVMGRYEETPQINPEDLANEEDMSNAFDDEEG